MPWIEVKDPYARPPRLKLSKPATAWSGYLDVEQGWAELVDVEVKASDLGLSECQELSVTDCVVDGGVVANGTDLSVALRRSTFDNCDFGQSRITSIRNSRIEGCKLVGTDLSSAVIADVVFERCTLRYANLRMAKLSRVLFLDCSFDEVDCFELEAEDVEFTRTQLQAVNVDRLQADRVDLRGATDLQLIGVDNLRGCLVSEHQLPALAYSLATAAGLGIEQLPDELELD